MEQIAKVGIVSDIQPKSQGELCRLVRQKCQKAGCSMDPVVATILVDRCGTAMETLMRECDKLIAYRGEGEITRADVELVTHQSLEASVYDLSKAMLGNSRTRAFQLLNDLFLQREEPLRILSVLTNGFLDLYRAKAAHNAGKTAEDVLALFKYGNRQFAVRNAFRDVPKYSMRMIRESLRVLERTELAMKSGGGDDRILLQEAVAQILALKEEG
jgi:DNA polymerase-3 subunit delta